MELTHKQVAKILRRKPRRTVYQMNYARLKQLGVITDQTPEEATFTTDSSSVMDLTVERIEMPAYLPEYIVNESCFALSLAHYSKQNGDLLTDPEMVLLIDPKNERVEALTFESTLSGTYQVVYQSNKQYVPIYQKEHNKFLAGWLTNIKNQGHALAA